MQLIVQTRKSSCNVACMQMVLHHHNIDVDEQHIRDNLPRHRFGSTSNGLLTTQYPSSNNHDRIPDGTFIVGVAKDVDGTAAPHYIVVEKRGATCNSYDPQDTASKIVRTEEILMASRRKEQRNNVWLRISKITKERI